MPLTPTKIRFLATWPPNPAKPNYRKPMTCIRCNAPAVRIHKDIGTLYCSDCSARLDPGNLHFHAHVKTVKAEVAGHYTMEFLLTEAQAERILAANHPRAVTLQRMDPNPQQRTQ